MDESVIICNVASFMIYKITKQCKHSRSFNIPANIEYFMESPRVRCLHTSCGISEIEQVSEANE